MQLLSISLFYMVTLSFFFFSPPQKVLSRQEELKERARLLLEQARRDAAMKAGNKNIPNSTVTAPNRATTVCDVSQNGVCVCVNESKTVDILHSKDVYPLSKIIQKDRSVVVVVV